MRLWNLVGSLAVTALALSAWRFADGVAIQEPPQLDGTCQAIEELAFRGFSVGLMGVAVAVLFLRWWHLQLPWRWLFEPADPPSARSRFEAGRVGDPPEVLFN